MFLLSCFIIFFSQKFFSSLKYLTKNMIPPLGIGYLFLTPFNYFYRIFSAEIFFFSEGFSYDLVVGWWLRSLLFWGGFTYVIIPPHPQVFVPTYSYPPRRLNFALIGV